MKKSVKILALAMALVLVAAAFTACGGQKAPETSAPAAPAEDASAPASGDGGAAEKSYKVALVSDMAVDEAEWLQNLVAGLGDYQTEHPNIEVKVVEATQSSEYEPKTRALAQAGYNIIITTNSSMADATTAVAADFPDILFGSLDGVISDIADYPNLQEFGLNRTETGYLAGVAAACATKANKVGIVAGRSSTRSSPAGSRACAASTPTSRTWSPMRTPGPTRPRARSSASCSSTRAAT